MKNLRERIYHKFSISLYHIIRILALLLIVVVLSSQELIASIDDHDFEYPQITKTDLALYSMFNVKP